MHVMYYRSKITQRKLPLICRTNSNKFIYVCRIFASNILQKQRCFNKKKRNCVRLSVVIEKQLKRVICTS